ncbi:hypothetical protein [Soonwooa sp.]|uniref:hypothetical protein n=1 Tax=Soonwooa sp. TaxID=1938592 RepID=UPI002635289A|nr:hypothetical protein [Soonwooa sp.]
MKTKTQLFVIMASLLGIGSFKSQKIIVGSHVKSNLETKKKINIDISHLNPSIVLLKVAKKDIQASNFNYRAYYPESTATDARKGIVILGVGDGGNVNDGLLNDQCDAIARMGFVAIVTTYEKGSSYADGNIKFKQNIEEIISKEASLYGIPRSKVVVGGVSKGGNLSLGISLPGQMGNGGQPIEGIKGLIIECGGGDQWKGSALKLPVLYMANATDGATGGNGTDFRSGIESNTNADVKAKSKFLIAPGEGHCTNSADYKNFIINNINSFFN